MMRMYQILLGVGVPGLLMLACNQLNVDAGESNVSNEPTVNQADVPVDEQTVQQTWNSLSDALQYLQALREQAPQLLIDRYKEDGRDAVRGLFRQFRDAIAAEAVSELEYAPWRNLEQGACLTVDKEQILGLSEYGDLAKILEMSYIGRLRPQQAEIFNPELPEKLDDVSKLALFEFGIGIDGESLFNENGSDYTMSADLRWKVIHETGDAENLVTKDASGVLFKMTREYFHDASDSLSLEAIVGEGLYDGVQVSASPALMLSYTKSIGNVVPETQSLEVQRGIKNVDGSWENLYLSRKLDITYNRNDEKVLELVDTDMWQLPTERVRRFTLNIGENKVCYNVSITDPAADGSGTDPDTGAGAGDEGSNPPSPGDDADPIDPDNPSQIDQPAVAE